MPAAPARPPREAAAEHHADQAGTEHAAHQAGEERVTRHEPAGLRAAAAWQPTPSGPAVAASPSVPRALEPARSGSAAVPDWSWSRGCRVFWPPPTRASAGPDASDGATRISAARTASQRMFFILIPSLCVGHA